jgi:hypothetical protein
MKKGGSKKLMKMFGVDDLESDKKSFVMAAIRAQEVSLELQHPQNC